MKVLTDMILGLFAGSVACLVFFSAVTIWVKFIDRMKYQHLSYKPEFLLENKSKKSKK